MSAHTVVLEAFIDGAWVDVATEALTARKLQITRGLTEQGELRPAKITWTFYDPTDKWRPTNPESPLYGLAGRNMPVRVTVDGSTRAYAEASSFQPEQELGGPRMVNLTAEGLQRRLGLWTERLRSPLYRMLSAQPLCAYWPLEDGQDATAAASATSTAPAARVVDVEFGDDNAPGGAAAAVTLRTVGTSRIAGQVPIWTVPTNGYSIMFYFRLPTAVSSGSAVTLAEFRTAGRVTRWVLGINNSPTFSLDGYDSEGVAVVNRTVNVVEDPTEWLAVQLETEESGGNVDYALIWHRVGNTNFWAVSGTYAGTADRANSATLFAPVADTRVSHLWVGDDSLPFVDGTFQLVSAGYAGETAGNRFARLLTEAGLDHFVSAPENTTPMGAQKGDTLLELIKEIARTEDGLVYDSKFAVRLTLKTRAELYNQTPKLALTWPDDIAPPFAEMIDDDGVYNHVTVSQRDGGEATAVLEDGPLSIQPPPAGVGEYRHDVDVNIADERDLPQLAGWWLNRGTAQGLGGRYPQVTVDLDATPSLTTAVNNVEIGDRITIASREPELISLLVLGIAEPVETHRRLVTFTCVRDTVFHSGLYDDGVTRYDSRSTTVKTAVTSSATAITFRTTDAGDLWSTTSEPYDVLIAGERLTVTAMGAASLVSGAYDQVATVTRSVNGVTKAQAVGAEIHIATPGRWLR